MFQLAAFSTIALSLAVSVSSLVVPRATQPSGWDTDLLESYDTYHARYMALSCETQHGSTFFTQCCHPLLATQTLATARPAQCIPSASSAAPAAASTATDSGDDSTDDDLPFCDDSDDDDDSTTPAAPAATQAPAPAATTPHPAVTTPAPAAPKPVETPASNSASGTVETGGFATFFFQNGNAGACGEKNPDSALIAAIDGARYGNLNDVSPLCGKQVKITNLQNKKTVTVTIKDACPTCTNSNSIDLSVGAFNTISEESIGEVPITWEFV